MTSDISRRDLLITEGQSSQRVLAVLGFCFCFPRASEGSEVNEVKGVLHPCRCLSASEPCSESGLALHTSCTHIICRLPVPIVLLLHQIPLPACRKITPGTLIRLFLWRRQVRRNPPLAKPVFFSSFLCRCSGACSPAGSLWANTNTCVKFHWHQSRGVWMENIFLTHLTFRFLLFLFFFFLLFVRCQQLGELLPAALGVH